MNNNEHDILLDVKDLHTHFTSGHGKRRVTVKAVNGVSFHVKRGETFGLVGESGCGKTTLGRTIIRLYDPTAGEIVFDGKPISGKKDRQLQRFLTTNIAMIFQDPMASLNPRMTVQEIIAEGLNIKGIKDEATIRKMVEESLYRVGLLPEHATRYPHEFSGGQRQRIGIARALIVNPTMVIADEPISALDVSIQAQVINVLNDLKREMGLTILFIAHDLSVVRYFSDTIGVMHNGRIVEMGAADKVYQNPIHPYTKSLISSIPLPNPHGEKRRVRINYDAAAYRCEDSEALLMRTVESDHSILCTKSEYDEYLKQANGLSRHLPKAQKPQ